MKRNISDIDRSYLKEEGSKKESLKTEKKNVRRMRGKKNIKNESGKKEERARRRLGRPELPFPILLRLTKWDIFLGFVF